MSKVMAVNAGSSSLKFQLFEMPEEKVLVAGNIERIGMDDAIVTFKFNGTKKKEIMPIKDHNVAVNILLKGLIENGILKSLDEINGVGHRVVQGGAIFKKSEIVTEQVAKDVEDLAELAPLHNRANINGYKAFHKALPNVGNIVVFDTSFHQTMPAVSYMYPVPYELYEKYGVRRYGAHGTSHRYVSERVNELLGRTDTKVITCHIGNGASLAAVKNGVCYNTSMGFTPLAGVMMGTRTGDIDPAVVPYLCKKLNCTADDVLTIFNKKSGYLGVSGISSDARDICDACDAGNERAILTRAMHVQTVANYIGQYYVELGGCDAIVFTAGLGENDPDFRRDVINYCEEALGCKIDLEANACRGEEKLISTPDSKIKVYVIPTNEELVIARDTVKLLGL